MLPVCLALALNLVDSAAAPRIFVLDPQKSTLGYEVSHTLHYSKAVSRQLEGKAAVYPDGTVQVMVRAKVASFLSKDSELDENMRETLEATTYPYVTFKGVATVATPKAFPAVLDVTINGVLDFHGTQNSEKVPMRLEFVSATEVRVATRFVVSLERYRIERPSFMLIKLDDACAVSSAFVLREGTP